MNLATIIRRAQEFVGDWKWYEITDINIKRREGDKNHGADWIWDDKKAEARIEVGLEVEIECIYHEVFHSVTHASPLHAGADEKWGDAWCDAFRYLFDVGPFAAKIDKYCKMSFDEVRKSGDWRSDKTYAYPCSLIIKKCGRELGRLKELWFRLCDKRQADGNDVLGKFFGYDIEKGVPVSN